MSLPADFSAKLPQQSSEELFFMLEHAADYLPEAVDSLRAELTRRNLASEQAKQLWAHAQDARTSEAAQANAPLGWPMRLFCLIGVVSCFVGVVPFFISVVMFFWFVGYYNATQQKRKARECGLWLLCPCTLWLFLWLCVLLAAALS